LLMPLIPVLYLIVLERLPVAFVKRLLVAFVERIHGEEIQNIQRGHIRVSTQKETSGHCTLGN